ncbi:hypothetical protein AA0119_g13334 [Alternaria tenuissima]|uniref:BZIP domain-containing protein n=2 Tax=Alternaria alternata complex TaxID=187734 RepID=A0A4Q4MYF1_ALTAL|nr:hypothetical protein AA0117_g12718 [Alternaria alternata]RYN85174.1 hypothetical protein AA0119_g13334 [Alternaria tenuissima]RYO04013.1 hypothetical protein AA0121_g12900 [Alternaria tenuissima]RYO47982.1 hypothetical protein AA0116_g12862 [Alternaria tenuissima]
MANRKYDDPADAKQARRRSNKEAQRKYRDKLKQQKRASQASPSDITMRNEMDEEAPTAVGPPDASAQEASSGVESVQDERRVPDRPNAPPTPLERMACIEQAIDGLLVSVKDPYVQKSLQDPITRIDLKFRDLVGRVHKTEATPVQRDARIVPSIQYHPHELTAASARAHDITADTIRSLTEQIHRHRAQCTPLTDIKFLSAQLDRARRQAIWTL